MRPLDERWTIQPLLFCVFSSLCLAQAVRAEEPPDASDSPYWLDDRGPGVPTSLFGTYIEKGQFLLYPFYEFEYNSNAEYSPSEFGFLESGSMQDYEGESFLHELLLFTAYAPTEWLAIEFEFAYYANATLNKASNDPTSFPNSINDDGFGDLQFQFRWRWWDEQEIRPYFFNYFEVVPPLRSSNNATLVGENAWELVYGGGFIKGFRWGTLSARISMVWEEAEGEVGLGEYAVEYLKRVNPTWRLYAAIEGQDDEVQLIPEAQYFFREDLFLKFNVGVGLTPKAVDVAPEIGVMFVF